MGSLDECLENAFEVGDVSSVDEFADAFEESLAKGGKSVYTERLTFR